MMARSWLLSLCGTMLLASTVGTLGVQHVAFAAPGGYSPSDIASAYHLPLGAGGLPSGGVGATVAIIDYNDAVNAEADLAQYRQSYGLPACTGASGCFKKVNQRNDNVLSGPITGIGGQCVDVPRGDGSNNIQIELYQCNNGNGQWWRLPSDGTVRSNANAWARLNGGVGMCLDVLNGGTANGSQVVLFDCNSSNSQQWKYQNGML